MAQYYYAKPKPVQRPYQNGRTVNEVCQYKWFASGAVLQCSVATKNGATYCEACERKRSMGRPGQRYKMLGGIN